MAEQELATKKTKRRSKKEVKEVEAKRFQSPTEKQFDVIIAPVITEKSMADMQNLNKVTVKVLPTAKRSEVKKAFESLFQVEVKNVHIASVRSKEKSRGSRYKGSVPGYKKAIVTLAKNEALDLFKE